MATSVIVDSQGVAYQTDDNIPEVCWPKEERNRVVAELARPFPLSDIRWMLVEKSKDKRNGRFAPYVKSSVLIERLNSALGVGNWKKTYPRQETRDVACKDPKNPATTIRRSRTNLTCRLVLHGIGEQEANGEEWADDQNAITSSDAQAFKRACKCFGIGSYLDRLSVSVELDAQGRPKSPLTIPFEFLTDADKAAAKASGSRMQSHETSTDAASRQTSTPASASGSQPPAGARKVPVETKIPWFKQTLGLALYNEIVQRIKGELIPSRVPAAAVNQAIATALDEAVTGLARLRELAAAVPQKVLDEIMDAFSVETMTTIPSAEVLGKLLRAFEDARAGKAF